MACGQNVGQRGQLKLTGSVKYVGPVPIQAVFGLSGALLLQSHAP
jgi:hypothetical protein